MGLDPWKITEVVKFFLDTQTTFEKQLDPSSGLIDSLGRSVRPSVKYVDD